MTGSLVLEDSFHALQASLRQHGEFRTAMVDYRLVDGSQNTVGNVRRSRDLKEVSTWLIFHVCDQYVECEYSLFEDTLSTALNPSTAMLLMLAHAKSLILLNSTSLRASRLRL